MADAPAKNLKLAEMDIPASLRAAVEESQRIFCISHPSADGDAVGSLCGLRHALSALGKDVSLVLPDPKPQYLRYIPGWETILSYEEDPEARPAKSAAGRAFLCGGLWEVGSHPRSAPGPHPPRPAHLDRPPCGREPLSAVWNIWQPTAAATTEILYEFLTQLLKRPLPLPVRIALYTGLLTDTGGFVFGA